MPPVRAASGIGLLILAQQLLIGFAMGFALRLVFSAIDMAGTLISNQAGLGFATAYDPQNTSQTPVISEFIGFLALLVFLSINGHLMVITTVIQSFTAIPVGLGAVKPASWQNIAAAGSVIFSSGVFLALPILVTLMITNVALGILGRVAPQLNLIAIGFPVTIVMGFSALLASLDASQSRRSSNFSSTVCSRCSDFLSCAESALWRRFGTHQLNDTTPDPVRQGVLDSIPSE